MILNSITKNYLRSQVVGYVSKDQQSQSLNKYLRLDLGENLLGCSQKVLRAIREIKPEDLCFYADPSASLIKKTISGLYGLEESNILIANSSNEIIDFLPKMILNEGDYSLIIVPTFFRFKEACLTAVGKIVALKLNENNGFKPDSKLVDAITKNVSNHKIKIIWICNPNNPTGEIYKLEQIEKIIASSETFVVVDEAFFEFYDPTNRNSAIYLTRKYKNLLVLRTLSKAYGLAGLRFGYAIGHKKTIETIEKYRNTLLMTSSLIQKLTKVALIDQKHLQRTVKKTIKLRSELFLKIKRNKKLHIGAESKTNIFLLKHKTKDIYQELKKGGILTADFRNADGIAGEDYVRVTIGNRERNNKLLSALSQI